MLYLNGNPMPTRYFPNKELYLDTGMLDSLNKSKRYEIGLRFEGNDDLVALEFLKGAMDDMGFQDIILNCPFFPYSTMDHTDGSRPLSLKYAARMVNRMGFGTVKVMEPHSTVLTALVDRVTVEEKTLSMLTALYPCGQDNLVICFPDMGAAKRYSFTLPDFRTLTFEKERNFADGKIIGMRCVDDLGTMPENAVCVIVDDLCRGGRTFVECGKLLKEAGAREVQLIVTHMETGAFYSGILTDSSPVDKVYATDSCLPHDWKDKFENSKLHLESVFEGGVIYG